MKRAFVRLTSSSEYPLGLEFSSLLEVEGLVVVFVDAPSEFVSFGVDRRKWTGLGGTRGAAFAARCRSEKSKFSASRYWIPDSAVVSGVLFG